MEDLEAVLIRWREEAEAECLPSRTPSDLDWLCGRLATVDDLLTHLRDGGSVAFEPRLAESRDRRHRA